MSIDLSRLSTHFNKEFRGVRMQQGRVLTDDDFNQAAIIEAEEARRSRIHSIGAYGTPDQGFLPKNLSGSAAHVNFTLSAGSLYLGGQRLELRHDQPFDLQSNWLNFQPGVDSPNQPAIGQSRIDMVWIEAWEQVVTAVEDEELFEVALGGADTSVRSRIMHRVHITPNINQTSCASAWQVLQSQFASLGSINEEMELASAARLRVSFTQPNNTGTLCTPPTPGGFLGAENQAIRVQLVDSTHYTWGFDNGAPLYRVRINPDNATLTMVSHPKDAAHWPLQDQVVEILPWSAFLPNRAKLAELSGHLSRVQVSYNPNDHTLKLLAPLPANFNKNARERLDHAQYFNGSEEENYVYMRVWNRGDDLGSPAAIPLPLNANDANAKLGNTGLAIEFKNGPLRANDFWIIAARPAAPDKIQPWDLASANGATAHGLKRYRAPIGLIEWHNSGGVTTGKLIHDCRPPFLPLTKMRGCCTVTVGDGSNSFGHFSSINAAIAALPAEGGCVYVLPGLYKESVVIQGLHNITLHGCGPRSRIIGPGGLPALRIGNSHDIIISDLALEAGPAAVLEVKASSFLRIENNLLQCRDDRNQNSPWPALFMAADDALIEGNIIEILPLSDFATPDLLQHVLHRSGALTRYVQAFSARGGIQLAGGCERIHICNNSITGGTGNGITLGSLKKIMVQGDTDGEDVPDIDSTDPCEPCNPKDSTVPDNDGVSVFYLPSAPLYEIEISENDIYRHGANGIGVVRYFGLKSAGQNGTGDLKAGLDLVAVHGLTIQRNRIVQCLRRDVAPTQSAIQFFVGYGGIALGLVSQLALLENEIIDNGKDWVSPVSGLFALMVDGLRIERNRILHNGPRDTTQAEKTQSGLRAGVHIWLVFQSGISVTNFDFTVPVSTVVDPAPGQIRIDSNQIVQPLGRALFVLGAGPISIHNNYLASRGANSVNNDILAATVCVINFGISREWTIGLLALLMVKLFASMQQKNDPQFEERLCAYSKDGGKLGNITLALPTGKTSFSDNQVSFIMPDGSDAIVFSSALLLGLDDLGISDNQFEYHAGKLKMLADVIALATSLRVNNNRMAETWQSAVFSGFCAGLMNTTMSNQSTHCIKADGLETAIHANLTLSRIFCPDDCRDNEYKQAMRIDTANNANNPIPQ